MSRVRLSAARLEEWDVIGVDAADVLLVQVKTRDSPGAEERQALAASDVDATTKPRQKGARAAYGRCLAPDCGRP